MDKVIKGWHCESCGIYSKTAHEKTVKEWFLLFGGKMTNTDCREFLHVNMKTATRILQSMNLRSEGSYRNRTYTMDFGKLR